MSARSVSAETAAPLLSVEKLSVYYDQFRATHDIDLCVSAGEIVSIIGANGAGKSSFLKALVRQVDRSSGVLRFAGMDLAAMSTPQIVAAGVALVPEGRRLFPSLTVFENLRIGWNSDGGGRSITRRSMSGFRYCPNALTSRRACFRAGSNRWSRLGAPC